LLGTLTGSTPIQQFCLVGMAGAVTWAVLGTAARALMFPLGLLLFSLPFGGRITSALQDFTERFAFTMLTLSNVQAVLDGHVISIGGNMWRITEACGGINYFVASLAVGYVYAGAVYRQWGHRVAFLVASAVMPLAANGLRVYTTILLDHLGATLLVAGMGHYLYGVLVFGIVISVLFMTCGRWPEPPSTGGRVSFFPHGAAAVVSPVSARRTLVCATIGMLLAAIGSVSAKVLRLPRGSEARPDSSLQPSDGRRSQSMLREGENLSPWVSGAHLPK